MTTPVLSPTIAAYASEFAAARKSASVESSSWLTSLRESAWAEFEKIGFPTIRRGNETWKYTDLGRLDRETFARSFGEISLAEVKSTAPWNDDWHTAVVVDGKFAPGLSNNLSGTGIAVTELEAATASDEATVKSVLGQIALSQGNAFVALNTAMFTGGVFVNLAPGAEVEQPVHVINIMTAGADNRASYPRSLVISGANSSASVIESFINLSDGPQFVIPVIEVSLGEGATVSHYRIQLENEKTVHIGTTRTNQPANAMFNSTSFATGPAIGRNDVHTMLAEPGAETTLHGLYITNGKSHQDNEISTTHEKPHGTSHQYYKGILAGKSRAVFSGRVVVKPGAMKTLAEQKDMNLLLSHGAEIDTKPSLEIYADDVKCAHGATAGHVDKNMLFYLMSRGVSRHNAAFMLISGFAGEIVDEFEPAEVRDFLYEKLETIIPGLESEGIL
jgi:Fe-S cluster assembly protein SufD